MSDRPSQFDWVVVGGGSAGCTVARELLIREDRARKILLIEAGGDATDSRIAVPARSIELIGSPLDWKDRTEASSQLAGRRLWWPRGKGLGGSSSINTMIHIVGSSRDWDDWPKEAQDRWNYSNCHRIWESLVESYYSHGTSLDEKIRFASPARRFEISNWFLEACQEFGWPNNWIPGWASVGFGTFTRWQEGCLRKSPWDLLRAIDSDRLSIATDCFVQRLAQTNSQSTELELVTPHGTQSIQARLGVVLAAGAIQTPALLQRSGIGDRESLGNTGIPCRHDNPHVGQHLQDHLIFPIALQTPPHAVADKPSLQDAASRWTDLTKSPPDWRLASNLVEVGAFGSLTSSGGRPEDPPEFQIHLTATKYLEYAAREKPPHGATLGITLLRPDSQGSIEPVRQEGNVGYRIHPNYLEDPNDWERWLPSLRTGIDLASSDFWKRKGCQMERPGWQQADDEQLKSAFRRLATTLFHPVGTCRIGTPGEGVVSTDLALHAMPSVWVADASVLPKIPRGNPQGLVLVMAKWLGQHLSER
ncbi:MAG: GMC family oxidoreductase [Pirellulaceae bacterium]